MDVLSLEGYTADVAGAVVGREPNTLLVTFTTEIESANWPGDLFDSAEIAGMEVFYNFDVSCVKRDSFDAWVTDVRAMSLNFSYELEVTQVNWGKGMTPESGIVVFGTSPWEPGVNLFSVAVDRWFYPVRVRASTFATAVVHESVKLVNLTEVGQAAFALKTIEQARMTFRRHRHL